jgi:phenylacetate-coenzyme A ligase PaaK-like adenylate-forming protein
MTATTIPLDRWIAQKLDLGGSALTRTALDAWQMRHLRKTLTWVTANSAFYRHHLPPRMDVDALSLADFTALPFTTAADIAADPLRFVCVSQSDINRIVTLDTSGTTAPPKRLFFTEDDQEVTRDFFDHGLRLMTKAGDKVMILLPGDKPGSVGDLLFQAIPRFGGIPVLAGAPLDLAATVALAVREKVNLIIGVPIQVLALARDWRAKALGSAHIHNVLLCSDNVSDAVSEEIAAIWDCGIFQHWGMTEMGYGGGVDCFAHCGHHLQENDFLFEIVDVDSGRPLPPGETGEIVITTLTRRGMPLIRYRTGDLSRIIDGPCPCGSVLRRLDRILTRKTGLLSLSAGDVSVAALDDVLFKIPGVADFTANLRLDASPPILLIRASSLPGDPGADAPAIRSALDALPVLRAARDSGALRIEVEILPERLPFTRQKRAIRLEPTS